MVDVDDFWYPLSPVTHTHKCNASLLSLSLSAMVLPFYNSVALLLSKSPSLSKLSLSFALSFSLCKTNPPARVSKLSLKHLQEKIKTPLQRQYCKKCVKKICWNIIFDTKSMSWKNLDMVFAKKVKGLAWEMIRQVLDLYI